MIVAWPCLLVHCTITKIKLASFALMTKCDIGLNLSESYGSVSS
jgi:hypothetical protein